MIDIAVTLGLLAAPALGSTIGQTLQAMGQDAVFGPGCGDTDAGRTIQAPARWTGQPLGAAAELGREPLVVMAAFDGQIVRSVHLSRTPLRHVTADECRAQLFPLSGHAVDSGYGGTAQVFEHAIANIAGSPARYRAIYRPMRGDCRVMLTIGA
jgi:hypothetical protein